MIRKFTVGNLEKSDFYECEKFDDEFRVFMEKETVIPGKSHRDIGTVAYRKFLLKFRGNKKN